MPSRSLSFHQDDNHGVVVTPRGLANPNTNVFDKAFNEGLGLEEWDEWMKWEGATTAELPPASIERSDSMESSVASPDTWAMGLETTGVDMMSTSYSAAAAFPFPDAQFELEDTPPTSAGSMYDPNHLPLYPETASYPTQDHMPQELRRSNRGFSSLTEVEERNLRDIAMPYYALSSIKIASAPASPTDSQTQKSLSPLPEPIRASKNNKRKSADLGEQPSATLCQSRKRGHNAIEKRYRTNLNAKIELLREGVPSICGPNDNLEEEESDGEGDGKSGQQKHGKAAILMRALEYIQHLEKTTQRLGSEVDILNTRLGAFEKLAMSGSIILNGSGMEARNRPALTKSETLESIQSDFQQIQPKPKAATGPATRRRGSRQTKGS